MEEQYQAISDRMPEAKPSEVIREIMKQRSGRTEEGVRMRIIDEVRAFAKANGKEKPSISDYKGYLKYAFFHEKNFMSQIETDDQEAETLRQITLMLDPEIVESIRNCMLARQSDADEAVNQSMELADKVEERLDRLSEDRELTEDEILFVLADVVEETIRARVNSWFQTKEMRAITENDPVLCNKLIEILTRKYIKAFRKTIGLLAPQD